MNDELSREYASLESERRMQQAAIKGYQHRMSEQLNGSLGKDMIDILSGEKKIQLTKRFKFKNFWRRLLCIFN